MIRVAKEVVRGARITSRLFITAVQNEEVPIKYDFEGPLGRPGYVFYLASAVPARIISGFEKQRRKLNLTIEDARTKLDPHYPPSKNSE